MVETGDVFDKAQGVDAHLQQQAPVHRLILRAAVVIGVRFLRQHLDDGAEDARPHQFPHRQIGLFKGCPGHFVELFAGALGCGDDGIQVAFGEGARFFRVDVFARFHAVDGLLRLVGPVRRTK